MLLNEELTDVLARTEIADIALVSCGPVAEETSLTHIRMVKDHWDSVLKLGAVGEFILGGFVADNAYSAKRLPGIGETISGSGFSVCPGGKGSNQAVAAARAGAQVAFISKIGVDTFGDLTVETFAREGIAAKITRMPDVGTGAPFIYVNETNGDNAIIVYPGRLG